MIQTPTQLKDLTAFCEACPDPTEVTALLETLGFSLVFSMPTKRYVNYPPTPAQYHYRDGHGTEVIFLAGRDHAEHGKPLYPSHASRWWLYGGSSQYAYNLVQQELSVKFGVVCPTQCICKS